MIMLIMLGLVIIYKSMTHLRFLFPAYTSESQADHRVTVEFLQHLLNITYSPAGRVLECVVPLDAEKAFNPIEWSYLFSFGLGPNFILLIKLL